MAPKKNTKKARRWLHVMLSTSRLVDSSTLSRSLFQRVPGRGGLARAASSPAALGTGVAPAGPRSASVESLSRTCCCCCCQSGEHNACSTPPRLRSRRACCAFIAASSALRSLLLSSKAVPHPFSLTLSITPPWSCAVPHLSVPASARVSPPGRRRGRDERGGD